jgi:hypothetical protein
MGLSTTKFATLRPFIYHLTAAANLALIRQKGRLLSANHLFTLANADQLSAVRRRQHHVLRINDQTVIVRDQAPLHEGNMSLDEGWEFPRFVKLLNDMVFFWPGKESGPISYGRRHYERYLNEDVRILRVQTTAAFAASNSSVLVCKYNSGSPRWNNGRPSPRGASTFIDLGRAPFSASSIVEVVFREELVLPPLVEIALTPFGPWSPL